MLVPMAAVFGVSMGVVDVVDVFLVGDRGMPAILVMGVPGVPLVGLAIGVGSCLILQFVHDQRMPAVGAAGSIA